MAVVSSRAAFPIRVRELRRTPKALSPQENGSGLCHSRQTNISGAGCVPGAQASLERTIREGSTAPPRERSLWQWRCKIQRTNKILWRLQQLPFFHTQLLTDRFLITVLQSWHPRKHQGLLQHLLSQMEQWHQWPLPAGQEEWGTPATAVPHPCPWFIAAKLKGLRADRAWPPSAPILLVPNVLPPQEGKVPTASGAAQLCPRLSRSCPI